MVSGRYGTPFPDAGQGLMRQIDESGLRVFRSAEGDSRSSSGLFVKSIGVNLELDVGEQAV